ncbi:MAG: helix-turn-helix domain-containing protein [Asgard group archaeon]|nr:helix-turn-helix domain-containing protein [Asgard group archaeon]
MSAGNEALALWKQLLLSIVGDENEISTILKQISQKLGLSLKEIAEKADIPVSTLYKLSSTESDTRLSTIRKLVQFIRKEENKTTNEAIYVGLITSRDVLDTLGSEFKINGKVHRIREYLANTIEEEIIMGIRAVREGISAIVCGPVAANTLRRIVDIPVIGIAFSKESFIQALEKVQPKI